MRGNIVVEEVGHPHAGTAGLSWSTALATRLGLPPLSLTPTITPLTALAYATLDSAQNRAPNNKLASCLQVLQAMQQSFCEGGGLGIHGHILGYARRRAPGYILMSVRDIWWTM